MLKKKMKNIIMTMVFAIVVLVNLNINIQEIKAEVCEDSGGVGYSIGCTFPDPKMAQAIAIKLDKSTVDMISITDITNATNWDTGFSNKGIESVAGIQHFTNLNRLHIDKNKISDLSPLAALTNLNTLHLGQNGLSSDNLSDIKNLINLQVLYLGDNKIDDVTYLSGLTNLTLLYLVNNQLVDISPLSALVNLDDLHLGRNNISELTPLATLSKLTKLNLNYNQVVDVSPLSTMSSLRGLQLNFNQIKDVVPLSMLIDLEALVLSGNQISDVTSLKTLTKISFLQLVDQKISLDKIRYFDKVTIDNIVIDENGNYVAPNIISNDGEYDGVSTIKWENLADNLEQVDYTFTKSVTIGNIVATFSGEVIQPLEYGNLLYQLDFDLNGGSGSIDSQMLEEGFKAEKPETPIRDGYSFIGWNTEKDGSGAEWNFETTVMPADNVILYAQWDKEDIDDIDDPDNGDDSKELKKDIKLPKAGSDDGLSLLICLLVTSSLATFLVGNKMIAKLK